MRIEERQDGDVLIVKPGEQALDAYAAASFREHLAANIQRGNCKIVLDLETVSFLDSTGLGAIVSSLKRLDSNGIMVICNVGEMVMDVFRLTRMDRVFPIVRSLDEAILVARDPARRAA